jgi:uncharacterized membrane protein YkoI
MNKRTIMVAAVGIFALGAGAFGAATAFDDPERKVEPVELTAAGADDAARTDEGSGGASDEPRKTQEVEGLTQLEGTLVADDDDGKDDDGNDDGDDWMVSGVDLDLGPDDWVRTATATEDFDGDGTVELIVDELRGLAGKTVTVGVRYEVDDDGDDDGRDDDADVYTLQGLTYRDLDGPGPWRTGDDAAAVEQTEIERAALAAVGPDAKVTQVERDDDDDDREAWKVDVTAADGREYEVTLSLAGEVLDVELDD